MQWWFGVCQLGDGRRVTGSVGFTASGSDSGDSPAPRLRRSSNLLVLLSSLFLPFSSTPTPPQRPLLLPPSSILAADKGKYPNCGSGEERLARGFL